MSDKKNNALHQSTYRAKQKILGNSRKTFYLNPETKIALQSKRDRTGKSFDLLINEAVNSAYHVSTLHDAEFKKISGLDTAPEEKLEEQSWEDIKL